MQVSQCATRKHSDGTMASRNKQRRILFPSVGSIRVSFAILFMAGCGSVAVALPQAVPANSSGAESPIAIIHVTVIDTKTGGEADDRTVVISNGRILSMKDNKTSRVPPGAKVLDATGKFLIPGLWDMHVHETRNFDTLPLYIANGVTGVREMSGPPDANKFRSELAARHPLAPHIYLGSPLVDGNPPDRPEASIVVETQEQAREVVDDQKRRGADFIKVYNELSPTAYFAIAAEAKRQHIPVEGHIPVRVSALDVTAAGQKSIEHLLGIARACSSGNQDELLSKAIAARDELQADRVVLEAWHSFDEAKCQHLFAEFKKNGSWPVPTLDTQHSLAFFNDSRVSPDPRSRYFGGEFGDWVSGKFEAEDEKNWTTSDYDMEREILINDEKVVGELYKAGVPMLAGTDSGNALGFPGFSLHDELALLVDSGMSPFAALQAATWNPAVFMGATDRYGSIQEGKRADLLLLDADPSNDIHNTTKIFAVFFEGREFDRAALDRLLHTAEANAKAEFARAGTRGTFPEPNHPLPILDSMKNLMKTFAGTWVIHLSSDASERGGSVGKGEETCLYR